MSKRIYVGNIPFGVKDNDLRALFSSHGEVVSVNIISDRETGRSRGFAFVEMEAASADKAIESLNNTDYNGRTLRVNEARERAESGPRSGGRR